MSETHNHGHHENHEAHAEHPHGHEHQTTTAAVTSPSLILQGKEMKSPHLRDEKIEFFFKGKKDPTTKEIIPGSKRPNVELLVPVLTFDGLIEKLSVDDPKVQNWILDLVNNGIKDGVRMQVTDEEKPVNRQSELDLSKLTVEYLANIPASERAGSGISDELWTEFEKDYNSVMVTATGKDPVKVAKAAKLLVGKCNAVKGDKTVLAFLLDQLGVWATNTQNLEDLGEVFKYLDSRINTLMNKDEKSILESL